MLQTLTSQWSGQPSPKHTHLHPAHSFSGMNRDKCSQTSAAQPVPSVLAPQGSLPCSRTGVLSLEVMQRRSSCCRMVPACTVTCWDSSTASRAQHPCPAFLGTPQPCQQSSPSSKLLCQASGHPCGETWRTRGPQGEPQDPWFLVSELQETSPFSIPSSATTAVCASMAPYLAVRPWIEAFLSMVSTEPLALPVSVLVLSLQENPL